MISIDNINKKYGDNDVLKSFSLDINKGDMIAITGKSGSGKSTLLNIIGLLEEADSGKITIDDIVNPKFKTKAGRSLLKNKIGFIFQNFALIEDYTVLENFKVANQSKKISDEELEQALKFVGMEGTLSRKVYTLSGGEQQRIAIAKILIKKPEIILADEPTGSLDEENRDIILHLLFELNKQGITIVIVTHDKHVSYLCSREVSI